MLTVDFVTTRKGSIGPSFRHNMHVFPLFEFRSTLRQHGITVKMSTLAEYRASKQRNGVLCVDGRVFRYEHGQLCAEDMRLLTEFRSQCDRLLWFDTRDSSGTTQFEVLPTVDLYCKKQLLRNHSLYTRNWRENRRYVEELNRLYAIDEGDHEAPGVPLDLQYDSKLRLSWNLAYADYRSQSYPQRYLGMVGLSRSPRFHGSSERSVDLQARYSLSYQLPAITMHRRRYQDTASSLTGFEVRVGRIKRKAFLHELQQTRAVLSPFGYGEICYRDFEAMVFGCALIKPDISDLETWPDVFQAGKTYVPLPLDSEESRRLLQEILGNHELLDEVRKSAQAAYRNLWTKAGIEHFVAHFKSLLESQPHAA